MMEEGSTKRTVEELQATLDKLGSSVSISAGSYTTDISVSTLEKNLPQTLAIVQEVLFEPKFDEQDFERVKKQMLEGVVYQHQQPSWMASQATREVLFGDSIFARASDGTKASLSKLTLDDVKNSTINTTHLKVPILLLWETSRRKRLENSYNSLKSGKAMQPH